MDDVLAEYCSVIVVIVDDSRPWELPFDTGGGEDIGVVIVDDEDGKCNRSLLEDT